MVLSVSRRFSSVCNEKLLSHVVVHAAVYQKKGSDSDRLMTAAQASLIQRHNILQESIIAGLFI